MVMLQAKCLLVKIMISLSLRVLLYQYDTVYFIMGLHHDGHKQ